MKWCFLPMRAECLNGPREMCELRSQRWFVHVEAPAHIELGTRCLVKGMNREGWGPPGGLRGFKFDLAASNFCDEIGPPLRNERHD